MWVLKIEKGKISKKRIIVKIVLNAVFIPLIIASVVALAIGNDIAFNRYDKNIIAIFNSFSGGETESMLGIIKQAMMHLVIQFLLKNQLGEVELVQIKSCKTDN